MSGIQQGLIASYKAVATSTLLTGITAYWKLDESSGNATDYVGTNTGVNTSSIPYATGKINNGLNNDNTVRYLSCGNTGQINTSTFSISYWINTSVTTEQNYFYSGGSGTNEWCILGSGVISSSKANFYFVGKTSPGWHISNASICDGTWHHVVCTVSTTQINIYIDGSLDKTISTTGTLTTTAHNSYIGWRAHPTPSSYPRFNGTLDEIGIWSKELISTEVTSLYNGGTGLQYPF